MMLPELTPRDSEDGPVNSSLLLDAQRDKDMG